MGLATRRAGDGLEWRTCEVQGRRASFAVGGDGLPVVFLHGWGLGHRAYQDALRELVAPRLPRLRPGPPRLRRHGRPARRQRTIEGYAAWVDALHRDDRHRPSRRSSSATPSAAAWPSAWPTTSRLASATSC